MGPLAPLFDRRRTARRAQRANGEVIAFGRRHPAHLLDVSPAGLFVQTHAVLPVGARVQLEVRFPEGERLQLPARVAHHRHLAGPLAGIARSGLGLRLLDPPPAWRRRVEASASPSLPPLGQARKDEEDVIELVDVVE